jgi:hypothetical protein
MELDPSRVALHRRPSRSSNDSADRSMRNIIDAARGRCGETVSAIAWSRAGAARWGLRIRPSWATPYPLLGTCGFFSDR